MAPADEYHAPRVAPEIRTAYPHFWAVPRDVRHNLFASAEHEIDILVRSGLFLLEDTVILQLLATKADVGIRIRIFLGSPDSPEVAQRSQDEGIGDSAAARIRNVNHLRWAGASLASCRGLRAAGWTRRLLSGPLLTSC